MLKSLKIQKGRWGRSDLNAQSRNFGQTRQRALRLLAGIPRAPIFTHIPRGIIDFGYDWSPLSCLVRGRPLSAVSLKEKIFKFFIFMNASVPVAGLFQQGMRDVVGYSGVSGSFYAFLCLFISPGF